MAEIKCLRLVHFIWLYSGRYRLALTLSKQLGIIVRDAGYHDTRNFMDAYHRCEDTVREYHEWLETHPEEKKIAMESVLDRLRRYQEQAKISKVDLKRYNERNVPER